MIIIPKLYSNWRNFYRSNKNDIFQPNITDQDFTSTNVNNAGDDADSVGYSLYVSNIRYQKNLESAQPIKTEFKFSEDVPARIYGYALVLTNQLVSISSDGQRQFDTI